MNNKDEAKRNIKKYNVFESLSSKNNANNIVNFDKNIPRFFDSDSFSSELYNPNKKSSLEELEPIEHNESSEYDCNDKTIILSDEKQTMSTTESSTEIELKHDEFINADESIKGTEFSDNNDSLLKTNNSLLKTNDDSILESQSSSNYNSPLKNCTNKSTSFTSDFEKSMLNKKFSKKDIKDRSDKKEKYDKMIVKIKAILPTLKLPVNIQNYEMRHEDVSLLLGPHWLNDKIINSYMEFLHEYDPEIYIFSSYFYTNLRKGGIERVSKYTSNINIFEYRLLFFPVHLHNHWVFVCYDVLKKKLEYRDSLGGSSDSVLENLSEFIESEYKRIYNEELSVSQIYIENIRKQDNGHDCGVFTLMYAKQRVKDYNNFIYKDMKNYRRIILYEIFIEKKIEYFEYD
ncbi:sumo-specific peptidase 1 (SENP1) [Vairimorpha necatrix]|uniref:Sumo-specific peptidase 1 (SENP1) n=1 Tax=Vairimorpha necatrix TaxID=6039 RepID=A0AAX4JC31_9MICR